MNIHQFTSLDAEPLSLLNHISECSAMLIWSVVSIAFLRYSATRDSFVVERIAREVVLGGDKATFPC